MPGRYLPLERGGDRRLRLRWGYGYADASAELDGREVARIEDVEALREGRRFPLGDGTTLELRRERLLYPALVVERDGEPLPGSDTDPEHVARVASWVLYFVAAIALILGGTAVASDVAPDAAALAGLLVGLVYGTVGWFVRRCRRWAVAAGMALVGLDGVSTTLSAVQGEGSWVGVLARVAFLLILARAWLVLRGARDPDGQPDQRDPGGDDSP